MWQSEPTHSHYCDFPRGPLSRNDIEPVWRCDGIEGCGMEYDVHVGDWHFWWSPETSTGVRKKGSYGYDIIECSQESLCIVFPRVEFKSRGKMPDGYTLGTSVDLVEDEIGPRPSFFPTEEPGFIRDIRPKVERETNVVTDAPTTNSNNSNQSKKRKWLLRG